MQTRRQYDGITWVDLESPTKDEVHMIAVEFGIADAVAEELLIPTSKARAEFYPTYVYTVMHFPALKHSHASREQEVDFIIGKTFLITTHYDTVDPLHKLSKVFEVNALLETSTFGAHAGFLFFYAIRKLYKAVEYELDLLRGELSMIEEHIFAGHEITMVPAISKCSRGLLSLRQTIEPHRDTLRSLEEGGENFFGIDFLPHLRALSNEYYRVHNHVTRAMDFLHELRETNNSLLSTKQNETMKILTLFALFFLPLTFVAALFTIPVKHEFLIGLPNDFAIFVGMMGAISVGMYIYFRHKKWL